MAHPPSRPSVFLTDMFPPYYHSLNLTDPSNPVTSASQPAFSNHAHSSQPSPRGSSSADVIMADAVPPLNPDESESSASLSADNFALRDRVEMASQPILVDDAHHQLQVDSRPSYLEREIARAHSSSGVYPPRLQRQLPIPILKLFYHIGMKIGLTDTPEKFTITEIDGDRLLICNSSMQLIVKMNDPRIYPWTPFTWRSSVFAPNSNRPNQPYCIGKMDCLYDEDWENTHLNEEEKPFMKVEFYEDEIRGFPSLQIDRKYVWPIIDDQQKQQISEALSRHFDPVDFIDCERGEAVVYGYELN